MASAMKIPASATANTARRSDGRLMSRWLTWIEVPTHSQ